MSRIPGNRLIAETRGHDCGLALSGPRTCQGAPGEGGPGPTIRLVEPLEKSLSPCFVEFVSLPPFQAFFCTETQSVVTVANQAKPAATVVAALHRGTPDTSDECNPKTLSHRFGSTRAPYQPEILATRRLGIPLCQIADVGKFKIGASGAGILAVVALGAEVLLARYLGLF
jgi:hypothetical protein